MTASVTVKSVIKRRLGLIPLSQLLLKQQGFLFEKKKQISGLFTLNTMRQKSAKFWRFSYY